MSKKKAAYGSSVTRVLIVSLFIGLTAVITASATPSGSFAFLDSVKEFFGIERPEVIVLKKQPGESANDAAVTASGGTVAPEPAATMFTGGTCDGGGIDVEASGGTPAAQYTTLKGAFDAINAGTHTGTITIEVCGNTTEAASAVLNASGSGSASYSTISISPLGGAARTISGAIAGHLIDLNGADNVTIDGLNSGGNSLNISNTTAGASSTTIRFINDATNNTVTNSTILGSTTSTTLGTIFFSTTTGTTGNFGNTISNSNISAAGANLPTNAIYSLGTAAKNNVNTISGNNISDFFNAASASVGINIGATGNTGWTITNNKLFQTATRLFTTANTHSGILIGTGDTYTITGNIIGYANNAGTGTTNLVGNTVTLTGTFPSSYTTTGTANATRYIAINATFTAGAAASSIQNNTIAGFALYTSSGATTTNGVFCGIQVLSGNANIGTTTGNTIGTASASIYTAATTAGALIAPIYATSTNTVTIQNNTIQNLDAMGTTAGTSGSVNGINLAGTAGNFTVSGNTIGNTTNPNIRMGTLTTGANLSNAGTTFGAGTGASVFQGILNAATGTINIGTAALPNTIRNASVNSTSSSARAAGIQTSAGTNNIDSNTISNLTSPAANTSASSSPALVGIHLSISALTETITRNTIRDISSTAASAAVYVDGVYIGSTPAATISKNSIFNLTTASTSTTSSINGILLFNSSATINIYNNMMRLGVGVGNNPIIRGVLDNTVTSSPTNIIHNSIYIDGTQGANAVNTSCINKIVASTMTVTDNILWNNRASTGSPGTNVGRHYGIQMLSAAGNPTSNYNDIYAPNNGGTVGYTSAGTDQVTLANWRTATSQDLNSQNSDPKFVDATNATTPDLHINPAVTTFVEGNGTLVGAPTDDFDSQTRSGLTPVDIGADAGNFIGVDLTVPTITYTTLGTTTSTANRTLNTTITDTGSGVPTSGTGLPRLYFRKGASGAFATTQATSGGSGSYSFSVDYSLVTGGSVAAGDTIQYYVVAQDGAATPNVTSNPLTGASGFTASPPAASTPPTTPSSYKIANAITGSINVGTSQTYTSLTNTGGFFEAVNNNVVTGNVTVTITSNLTGETGSVALNQWTEEGAGSYTMLIKPDAVRSITGTGSGSRLITLNGADRVTIDGSIGGGGTDRSLTISNTNTANGTGTMMILSLGTGAGATSDTIKNCIIKAGNIGTTANFTFGLFVGDTSGASAGADNDNLTIDNNQIMQARTGIQMVGVATTGINDNTQITNNLIGDNTLANSIGRVGLSFSVANDATVTGNTIKNINLSADSSSTLGMSLSTITGTSSISSNTITGLSASGSSLIVGAINMSGSTGVTVSQNTISSIASSGSSTIPFGFSIGTSSGITLSQNNISAISGTASSTAPQAMSIGSMTGSTISRNVIDNITESSSGDPVGILVGTGATGNTFSRNAISNVSYTGTGGYGGRGMFISTGSATSSDTFSNNTISNIKGDGWNDFASDSIAGILITGTTGGLNFYFNSVNLGSGTFAGSTSGTLSAAFYVGPSVTALDLRDNIFATNLVNSNAGAAKSYAIYSAATNTAFTTINYNDYYGSGLQGIAGFISSIDRTTLANIQSGFGTNANSIVADPNFTNATNLKIRNGAADPVSPVARRGQTISGITTDFEGDTRKATPDIGADEFDTYLLTVGTTGGGTITAPASSPVIVNSGAATTITATANAGFTFTGWTVLTGSATFGNAALLSTTATISGDASVQANFTPTTYQLSVVADTGGTITAPASSPVTVNYGAATTITAAANAGYTFANWTVTSGSGSIASASSASTTITLTSGNATVQANFTINQYTITSSAGANGAISPSGATLVNHGANQTYTITPNAGYHVDTLTVDGGSETPATSYTFTNVTATHTIAVTFALNTYTITATAGPNGSISPSGAVSVNEGANQSFTITPNAGYHVDTMTVDGGSVAPATSYTFTNVTGNHTIDVTFLVDPTITVVGGPLNFGNQTIFTTSVEQTYTVQGIDLTGDITVTSPSTDFEVSLTTGAGFGPSVTLSPTGGTVATTTIYVHFKPGSLGAKSGDITNATPGAITLNVAVSGTGTAVPAVATKLVITNISPSTPTAGVGFSVTVESWDATNTPTNVLSNTGFTLSTNGNAGAISGTTTGTITAGTNSVVVSGVILPSAGSSVNITATRTSGDILTAGTSAGFSVVSVPTKFAVTNISPATPTAGTGFTVTVQAQDADSLASNVTATTGFSLSTNGNAGAISGATTGSISAGSATVTVPGVILANGGTGVTITATRTSGDNLTAGTSATFTVNEAAPTNLTYSANPATYTKDAAITPNTPSNNGGTAASYSISPSLPAGLSFSTSTGVISGTPTVAAAAANYTVTATNTGGSAMVDVNITINKATPVITFDAAPTPTYPGPNFTVSATTTNTDSAALTYSKVSGPCDFVSVATFMPTGAGSCVVQADGAGSANFNAASNTQTVTITLAQYTITATAGAGGSIAPAGVTTVNYDASQAYTITPSAGYHVLDVLVDGVSVGAVLNYTFSNVNATHTIDATFAINTYTITATAGANGAISPSGAVLVNHGDNQTFTITPNAGYHVDTLTVDSIPVPAATSYTFTNVTATHTIDVTFAINTYTITATAGANGAISPSGAVLVNHGDNQTFTITPNAGYHVDTLTVEAGPVPPATSYTFTNVTAPHTIDVTFAVNTTPIITFDAAPTPTYLGGDFTVNATTTNMDSSALTYSVVSGPCAPVSGATFSSTGAGTCVVQASGAATTNYNAATATQNVTIAKANQATVTLSGVPSTATYGDTFTAVGGGGSGTGAFSYAVTGTACTVDPSTGAGSVVAVSGGCSVTATRAGDTNYNPATSAASVITTINPANQATLTAVATPSTVIYGNTSALSSTGGSGTGAVTFSEGASTGCAVTGTTLSVTNAGGTCAVTATKAADANYNAATSAPLTVTLQKADQATLTVDDPGTVTYGSTPQLTTSGGSGTGAVTFSDGGSAGCSVTSGGVLTVTDASAACNVTATKASDNNYNATTSAQRTITLAKASQATLTAVSTPSSVTYGSTSTLSSTGGSGTGAVTFSSGASTGCSVTGTTLSVTNASGTCEVTATKAADNNYNAATSAALTVTLVKATPIVTFGAAPTPTYLGGNFTVSASTTNTDSSALTYSVVSGPCALVSGATFSSSGAGTCVVQASGAATSNFTAASATQSVTIAKATPTVIFGAAPTPGYPGADFTVSASTTNTDSSTLIYSKVSGPCNFVSGATFSSTGAGTCIVRADGAASTNFNAAFDTQNVTIAAVQYTITATAGANGSITPSGSVVVSSGANQAFTITANAGYHIEDVLVDGVSQGTAGSYTFTNVTANHTISASFAINTYTITASAGANGSITPNGPVVVNSGANQSFTITPDGGYNVANVLVDGVSVGAVTSHTFTNVTANHTIASTFFSGAQALIVYVDDNWAGTTIGTDPDGAGPATSFGYDAFATIQDGVAGVAINGTVIVNPGSYSGDIDVNRAIDVKGVFTTTGAVTVTAAGASISPGMSPGIINSGNVSLTAGSNVNIEVNGPILGTQYDQLNVTGTVNLGNANLNVMVGNAYTPSAGQTFTIVNNDGNDPIAGTFAGLAENDVFYTGTTSFRISYAGGSNNNDVVLTAVALCNSVSIPSYTTLNGNAVAASVNVDDTTGKALQSTDFTITYNPAVVTFGSASLGAVTAGGVLNMNSSTPGTLVVSIFKATPFSGAGSMLDITFNTVGQPGTSTPVAFNAFKFNEGTQCISTANGSVSVISGTITGIVTYGNSIPAATRHVPGTTMDAVGSVNASVVTNLAGAYSISSLGSGSYTVTPSKSGGVNGAVTGFDAAQIAMWVVGTTALNATQQTVADVSGTGGISSFDAALIARYAAALPNAGSSGAWRFSPTSTTYLNVNVNRTGDYTALLMGDVSGNWIDPLATRPAPDAEELKPVVIGVPELSALVNTEVVVPVEISDTTNKGILAYQFELRYDPIVLEPAANPADLIDTISSGYQVTVNATERGLLRVVVFGTQPLSGGGRLINLRFNAIGNPGSASDLIWENLGLNEGGFDIRSTNGRVQVTASPSNNASLGGRVMSAEGQPIKNARLTLTDTTGQSRIAITNGLGYYQFTGLQLGETYTVHTSAKRHRFQDITVSVSGEAVNLDIIAQPGG
jgi:hypothetical protein